MLAARRTAAVASGGSGRRSAARSAAAGKATSASWRDQIRAGVTDLSITPAAVAARARPQTWPGPDRAARARPPATSASGWLRHMLLRSA